jgi:lipoate-protein ligase A
MNRNSVVISFGLLDLTLPSPVENLALDEALLENAVENEAKPVLRLWESDQHFVVLGRSSNVTEDVHIDACRRDSIPILRRASGGGTVLQGPGCLSYALVLPLGLYAELRDIRHTYGFVLSRIATALSRWQSAIAVQGISDLAVDGRKICGSAQRRTKEALLFHGTILYRMHPRTITLYLKQPKRQPDYRRDRSHCEFLRTIDAPLVEMKQALADAWHADAPLKSWPQSHMTGAVANVIARSNHSAQASPQHVAE